MTARCQTDSYVPPLEQEECVVDIAIIDYDDRLLDALT
jgi:hypothetical protein